MRSTASFIRLLGFIIVSAVLLMYILEPEAPMSAMNQMAFWAVLSFATFLMIAGEICVGALKNILYKVLPEDAQQRFDEQTGLAKERQFGWIKRTYIKLLGTRPMEEEHEIILDHNYDGIRELDNRLPPWWLYGFYATILFGGIYLARFHVFGDYTQAEEYETEVAIARAEIEAWKKTAKDLVDVNTVTLLTEASDINAGRGIFNERCVACHKADGGGGIGPNLTDEFWILGGGIKNVFNTISEGGRAGKGMVPWKTELKPSEMAQVASFILTMQGTTPAEPKAPEGELWVDPDLPEDTTEATAEEDIPLEEGQAETEDVEGEKVNTESNGGN